MAFGWVHDLGMPNDGLIDMGSEQSSLFRWLVSSVDLPGFKKAPSRGLGTGGNHTNLSPLNGMTGRVCMFCLGWLGTALGSYLFVPFIGPYAAPQGTPNSMHAISINDSYLSPSRRHTFVKLIFQLYGKAFEGQATPLPTVDYCPPVLSSGWNTAK